MGAMKNLQKDRNGTFYVRLVVPQSLRPILGKGELKRSLKTKDWREANQRALAVLQEFQQLFEAFLKSSCYNFISDYSDSVP